MIMRIRSKLAAIQLRAVLPIFILLIIAIAGVLALKTATPYGPGLRNDSVQYIFGARNLLSGNGYTRTSGGGELKPITTVPPMLSAVIAALSLSGMETMRSARLLLLILFGLDVVLLGVLIHRLAHSWGFALAGAALFAFSDIILGNFAWLMSEPLFVFFWLICFLIFDLYTRSGKGGWLIFLGVLCGMSYLTRYIGVTLVVCFALVLLLSEPNWRSRLVSITCLISPFVAFMAGWAIRNTLLVGNPANRTFLSHLVTPEKLNQGIANFWIWLLPTGLEKFLDENSPGFQIAFYVLAIVLTAGLIYSIILDLRKIGRNPEKNRVSGLLVVGIYGFVYLGMTLLSMSFIDASTVLDHRLLIPVYLVILILLMAGFAWLYSRKQIVWKITTVIVVLVSLAFTANDGRAEVVETEPRWHWF